MHTLMKRTTMQTMQTMIKKRKNQTKNEKWLQFVPVKFVSVYHVL